MLATTLSAILALAGGSATSAVAADAKGPAVVPGELIVGFDDGASKTAQGKALAQAGATKAEAFPQIDAALVEVPAARAADATKLLLGDPRVRYVQPNYVVRTMATPNDPSFNQLWGMHNTGQTGGTPDADIDAPEAWNLTTGSSNVVVGVTDTGVDFGHPDLAAQQWVNTGENCGSTSPGIVCAQRTDGVDNDGNTYVDDWRGWDFVNGDNNPHDDNEHGTHVAGTIGAAGNNGVGVAGVNWNVKIMALKFLSAQGSGDTAGAIGATLYAANEGAHISSNSWGGGPFEQPLLDAIEYAASRGTMFVAAAGNELNNNDTGQVYPSSYPSEGIVSVAATDHDDGLAFFSNYGATSVDLGAPGVDILSTVPGGGYDSFSGTSMATPHVAGVAALLKARFPGASLYALKSLLLHSVDPVASLAGKTATGGRLNAFAAASCAESVNLWLDAPSASFTVTVGDTLHIGVIATNCATPIGLANVSATVNGSPVALTASSPDTGLYTASYFVAADGPLTVSATVTVGGTSVTQAASGQAFLNYICEDVALDWVDVTQGQRLTGADGDDSFSTLGIPFPVSFFGETYDTAYVSSNGFLALASNANAEDFSNDPLPSVDWPNGIVAALWDDLDPGAGGDVYAGVSGTAPNRTLHIEWHQVQHFSLGASGGATFELALKENGDVRLQYLDTDFGNGNWNFGASATAGLENATGVIGRAVSYEQPSLTNGRAVSCAYGEAPDPPPPPSPTITTTSLPGGQVGTAYSQTLAATGGTPAYTWSLDSGSLPAGLSLSSGGAITGTPTTAGPATFTVRVTDSLSQTDTQELTVAVAPPPVPTITTTSLPGGQVGQAYSQTLAATGGTPGYTWTLDAGALPAGLTLGSGGAVTGTPATAGSSTFTVRVTDSLSQTDTQELTIAVAPPPVPTITTTSLPAGTVGAAYSQTLAATGGTPGYTWTLDAGTLPAGLTLGLGGAITGTPTTAGSSTFTVRVTDSLSQTDTQQLTIVVFDVLTITTTSLPAGTVTQAYSRTVQAAGGTPPYSWSVVAGGLPPGLGLNPGSGVVSGTPTMAGTFSFTVQVSDAALQTDTQPFTVLVNGLTSVSATPSAVAIQTGTHRAGSAASLASDNNAYYQVTSTTSGTRTTAWYARFTGVTNALSNLRVTYKGKNSRTCTQTVAIWRWTTSSWVQLNSRSVGTSEVLIANLAPGGTLANYVSGTNGGGEVRVRIRCTRSSTGFFSSGDYMRITYQRP